MDSDIGFYTHTLTFFFTRINNFSYISLLVFHKFNKIRHLWIKSPFRRRRPHTSLSTPIWAVIHLCYWPHTPKTSSNLILDTSTQSLASSWVVLRQMTFPIESLMPWLPSTLVFNPLVIIQSCPGPNNSSPHLFSVHNLLPFQVCLSLTDLIKSSGLYIPPLTPKPSAPFLPSLPSFQKEPIVCHHTVLHRSVTPLPHTRLCHTYSTNLSTLMKLIIIVLLEFSTKIVLTLRLGAPLNSKLPVSPLSPLPPRGKFT